MTTPSCGSQIILKILLYKVRRGLLIMEDEPTTYVYLRFTIEFEMRWKQ